MYCVPRDDADTAVRYAYGQLVIVMRAAKMTWTLQTVLSCAYGRSNPTLWRWGARVYRQLVHRLQPDILDLNSKPLAKETLLSEKRYLPQVIYIWSTYRTRPSQLIFLAVDVGIECHSGDVL